MSQITYTFSPSQVAILTILVKNRLEACSQGALGTAEAEAIYHPILEALRERPIEPAVPVNADQERREVAKLPKPVPKPHNLPRLDEPAWRVVCYAAAHDKATKGIVQLVKNELNLDGFKYASDFIWSIITCRSKYIDLLRSTPERERYNVAQSFAPPHLIGSPAHSPAQAISLDTKGALAQAEEATK